MRIVDIILTELNSDKLKLEDDIERTLNNKDLDAQSKTTTIKSLLTQVVSLEMAFVKFKTYVTEGNPQQAQPTQQNVVDPNGGENNNN